MLLNDSQAKLITRLFHHIDYDLYCKMGICSLGLSQIPDGCDFVIAQLPTGQWELVHISDFQNDYDSALIEYNHDDKCHELYQIILASLENGKLSNPEEIYKSYPWGDVKIVISKPDIIAASLTQNEKKWGITMRKKDWHKYLPMKELQLLQKAVLDLAVNNVVMTNSEDHPFACPSCGQKFSTNDVCACPNCGHVFM